jgi:LysM repeat protein
MMRRRIFLWMGLGLLDVALFPLSEALARQTYKVKPGDTLAGISEKLDIPQETLKAANHLRGTKIKAHQILTIPEAKDKKKTARTSRPSASGQDPTA